MDLADYTAFELLKPASENLWPDCPVLDEPPPIFNLEDCKRIGGSNADEFVTLIASSGLQCVIFSCPSLERLSFFNNPERQGYDIYSTVESKYVWFALRFDFILGCYSSPWAS